MPDDNESFNLSGNLKKDSAEEKSEDVKNTSPAEEVKETQSSDTSAPKQAKVSTTTQEVSAGAPSEEGFIFLVKQTFSVFFK